MTHRQKETFLFSTLLQKVQTNCGFFQQLLTQTLTEMCIETAYSDWMYFPFTLFLLVVISTIFFYQYLANEGAKRSPAKCPGLHLRAHTQNAIAKNLAS